MSAFTVGQKVMCVKQFKGGMRISGTAGFNLPQLFNIYTVRAHCPCSVTCLAILLEEIHNKQVVFFTSKLRGEASFGEKFFAPLEKLSEEIELETTA